MPNKRLLLSCFYAFFFCGTAMLTLGSALPDISTSYSLTYSVSGALLSCYSLGNLASGILSGLAVLYLGPKIAAVILTLCVCAGMSGLTFADTSVMLMVSCGLVGFGRGSLITFSQGMVSLADSRPSTTGLLHAAFAAGAILAPFVFSALRVISWRIGLMLVAGLGLVAAGLFVSVKDYPQRESSSGRSSAFLREGGFIMIAALMFLYLCCEFALNGWLVSYMTHKRMTMNYAQSMAALLWVVMLAGRLACARLVKRVSRERLLVVLAGGAAVFFWVMLKSESRAGVALSVAGLGLFMSGISPLIYASAAPYSNKYPLAIGVIFTVGCTGGTIMPLITGIAAERFGFDGGMSAILFAFVMLVVLAVKNMLLLRTQNHSGGC